MNDQRSYKTESTRLQTQRGEWSDRDPKCKKQRKDGKEGKGSDWSTPPDLC